MRSLLRKHLPSFSKSQTNQSTSIFVVTKPSTFFLAVTKNSPKWILTFGHGFSIFNPVYCSRRWTGSLVTCWGMPSTHVRIIKTIHCLILTTIKTTDFRLHPDFWQLIISSSVLWYGSHLSTLLRLSCENLNLPISLFVDFWVAIPGFLSLDKIFNQLVSVVKNDTLF